MARADAGAAAAGTRVARAGGGAAHVVSTPRAHTAPAMNDASYPYDDDDDQYACAHTCGGRRALVLGLDPTRTYVRTRAAATSRRHIAFLLAL